MIDQVAITIRGGHGGAGGLSFVKMPGLRLPPPDGGNGGKGGDIYIEATSDKNTLLDFRFKKEFQADGGGKGFVNNRHGENGEDLVLRVPVGTEVVWLERVIVDLDVDGKKVLLVTGGKGGRGNMYLRTHEDRRPHHSEPGEEGELKELELRLKLLADVGLIGLPNAGKSTLLAKLTAAQPKIGEYPFTTIDPNLGVMTWKNNTAVLADLPGLIEGAAEGKGLGHQFLRHVERTKLLVHLTDSLESYETVRKELGEFDVNLLKKQEIVVLSRADSYSNDMLVDKMKDLRSAKLRPTALSVVNGVGLDELRDKIIASLS
jgi:GTP-binding protein